MSAFTLHIVTPEREAFAGQVQRLSVRTTEGDIGVLHGHTNLVSTIGVGPVKLVLEDGQQRLGAVSGGFISVTKEKTTLVADTLEWKDEIDIERAQKSAERTRNALKEPSDDREQKRLEWKLKKALNRIRIAQSE